VGGDGGHAGGPGGGEAAGGGGVLRERRSGAPRFGRVRDAARVDGGLGGVGHLVAGGVGRDGDRRRRDGLLGHGDERAHLHFAREVVDGDDADGEGEEVDGDREQDAEVRVEAGSYAGQ